jgi:hypothetical protein
MIEDLYKQWEERQQKSGGVLLPLHARSPWFSI